MNDTNSLAHTKWNCKYHFVGYLKGKSSLMIYEQFQNLKYKYRNR